MVKTDDIMWHILAITGLNFLNKRLGIIAKFIRTCFIFCFVLSLLQYAIGNVCLMKEKLYRESVVRFLLPFNSVLLWYISYSKRNDISYVVLKVYRLRKRYITSKKLRLWIIIILTIVGLVLPILACIYNQIITNFQMFDLVMWSFEFQMEYGIWLRVILFFTQISTFILNFSFPFYLMFCMCALFYRCSESLSGYNRLLQIQLRTTMKGGKCTYAEFFEIVNFLHTLNKTLTEITCFLILHCLEGIFGALFAVSLRIIFNIAITDVINLLYCGICSIIMTVYFSICCSKIPENLLEIKRTVRNFLNSCGYCHLISKHNLFYLMRIETEDIVYISVCGMFHVTRSYILSALGFLLTYGLLIINLKF